MFLYCDGNEGIEFSPKVWEIEVGCVHLLHYGSLSIGLLNDWQLCTERYYFGRKLNSDRSFRLSVIEF